MAEVSIRGVSKVYEGGVKAVRDVDLEIGAGEFVVLVGPSGCGKSTTLRMIAGLETISSGTISIAGRVVNDVHPKDRDIAMVFQNYALYPHMTVRQNMAFALKLRKMSREEIRRRVDEAARVLDLDAYLDRKPRALSGGQRQRVAVGRAIVREPKAFLFDEPLSNLDAKLRLSTRSELKALHQRLRTTTVYVTHDQEEAMSLGDRIVVMAHGEVQQVGTPFEVFESPLNRFVAGFIGTPPTNFIEGTVSREREKLRFVEPHAEGRAGFEAVLPESRLTSAEVDDGESVSLGLRPHAVQPAVDGSGSFRSANVIHLEVDVVEPLGEQMDIRGSTPGGQRVVFRVPSNSGFQAGTTAAFAVDIDRVHLFKPGPFGKRLTDGAGISAGMA